MKKRKAWAVRMCDYPEAKPKEYQYRVYPGFSKGLVRSLANDQQRRNAKVVRVEFREVR
jgi:hypothetical protein